MSRLLSVALTEPGVVERRKTVTRRLGWWEDKHGRRLLLPGHELTLCRKVMGRRNGEPLVRLAQVRVLDVRREQLDAITDADAVLEAVEGITTAAEFVEFYAAAMRVERTAIVTRIEWEYLDGENDHWTCGACGHEGNGPDNVEWYEHTQTCPGLS